jgi:hypothetical protein
VAIFCQTKRIFAGRSSAKVKKMGEVWRKMVLFGPDSVPPNQLLKMIVACVVKEERQGSSKYPTNIRHGKYQHKRYQDDHLSGNEKKIRFK